MTKQGDNSRKPPVGRRFKKGQSGNPKGRPPISKEIKTIRKLTHKEVARILELVLSIGPEELTRYTKRKDVTVLEYWIAAAATKGVQRGDFGVLNTLLDRVVGKVRERIDIAPVLTVPTQTAMLSTAMRVTATELKRLEAKAEQGTLTSEEHRSLSILSKSIIDLNQEERRIGDSDLQTMGDEELETEVKKALQLVGGKQK